MDLSDDKVVARKDRQYKFKIRWSRAYYVEAGNRMQFFLHLTTLYYNFCTNKGEIQANRSKSEPPSFLQDVRILKSTKKKEKRKKRNSTNPEEHTRELIP